MYLQEIKNTWNDIIATDITSYEDKGKEIYVRAERHPKVLKRLGAMGKLSDWAKAKLDSKLEARCFGGPHPEHAPFKASAPR